MDIKKIFASNLGKKTDPETERAFRKTCSSNKSQCSTINSPLIQDCQNHMDLYHQSTSLYLISKDKDTAKLFIYDTKSEREEERIIDTTEPLHEITCITQLSNGELFCFGNNSGTTFIIDKSYQVRVLPSGKPLSHSSSIYFNNSVYCFGGINKGWYLNLSRKYDLNENRWSNLAPMPQAEFYGCNALFNGNILIAGFYNRNIFIYSTNVESYSTISYKFGGLRKKILINAERLYLIEFSANYLIYESEDAYNWMQISKLNIYTRNNQSYCLYNKGAIYIATMYDDDRTYLKFDLSQKVMIKL